MEELKQMLLADYSIAQFLGYLFFMLLGVAYYSFLEIRNRNVDSKETPQKFSWKFWYRDNLKRYIGTLITIYVLFRFFPELTGNSLDEFTAFLLGFSGDGVVGLNKKSTKLLKQKRTKITK